MHHRATYRAVDDRIYMQNLTAENFCHVPGPTPVGASTKIFPILKWAVKSDVVFDVCDRFSFSSGLIGSYYISGS